MESTIPTVMSAQIPRPNRTLLSLTRNGDQGAREELARGVGSSAYVFALQLTGDPEAARDVAQDSALSFFKHLDRFDAKRPVEPWLYQIVRNKARDLMRRERLRRHESLDAWLARGHLEPVDPSADPAVVAEQSDLRQRIWRSISELSGAHREILVLRDYHDLSYREIAEVLSIPQGTVMSRLHAARRSLSEIIRAEGDSFPDQPPNRRRDR
jgi:RNA polymerase sigma-70 factor (ECF subfamily)